MVSRQKKNSHWPLTILMGLSSLMNLFLPLVLVRILTPDQVGQYKFFFLCVVTAPWLLLSSGFTNGLYFWAGQGERSTHALQATWSYQILWTAGIALLALATYPFSSTLAPIWNTEFYLLFLGSVACGISSQFLEEYKISKGQTSTAAWYSATWDFVRTISLILSALHWRNIESLIWAHFIISFFKFTVSNIFAIQQGIVHFNLIRNPESRAVFYYALPASGAAAFAVILGYADQFLIGHMWQPEQYALYSLGCLAIPPLFILEQSVVKTILPRLSKSLALAQSDSWQIVRSAVRDLSLWLIPSSVGLFFFADTIVSLLFTEKYAVASQYLKIYCWVYLLYMIPYDAWARSIGKSKWILKTTALFSMLSIILTGAGFWVAEGVGALSGLILTQALLRVYSLISMKRHLQWQITSTLPLKSINRHFLISALLGIIFGSLQPLFESKTWGLIALGTGFWISYLAICLPKTQKEERKEEASKNILFLTQYLHIGGLEKMLLNLCTSLKSTNTWEPSVYVYDDISGSERLDKMFQNIPITRNHKKSGFSTKLPLSLYRHCKNNQIDIIHAHDLGALIYAVLAKILSLGRLRVIYTQHSFIHLKKGPKYSFYEKIFPRLANEIVVVSQSLKDIYVKFGYSVEKISLIENGIPLMQSATTPQEKSQIKSILAHQHNLPANVPWIICLARLHPGKGQPEVLDIWKHLPEEQQKRLQVLFVGSETYEGFKSELVQKAKALPYSQNIHFLGSSMEPFTWLLASDIFISASHEEGLPLSTLEALAANVPLILSQIKGHSFFESVSLQFELSKPEDAAEQIVQFLPRAPEKIFKDYEQNRHTLLARFDVQRMMDEYVEIYSHDV